MKRMPVLMVPILAGLLAAGALRAGEDGDADTTTATAANAMLKHKIQELAQVKTENARLQTQLKTAQTQASTLADQNRELEDTNRRMRAVLRDLAQRGFPVYEVLGRDATGQPALNPDVTPEVAKRIKQLVEVLADTPLPRDGHHEDWDWSTAAQNARDELVKLGAPAVDPLLDLAAKTSNPVVKMRAGATILAIRQSSQAVKSATVLDIGDRGDMVSIGLGDNQGIALGQIFLLMRGEAYVGQVRVTHVWSDLCVASEVDRLDNPKVGDTAVALINLRSAAASGAAPTAPTAPAGSPVIATPTPTLPNSAAPPGATPGTPATEPAPSGTTPPTAPASNPPAPHLVGPLIPNAPTPPPSPPAASGSPTSPAPSPAPDAGDGGNLPGPPQPVQ